MSPAIEPTAAGSNPAGTPHPLRPPDAPVVRRLGEAEWPLYRRLRRAALADAPTAFWTTLAEVEGWEEDRWRDRLRGPNPMFAVWLGPDGSEPVGLAGGFRDTDGWGLISMWVAPAARGRGAAAPLIEAVVTWARRDGADALGLWVVVGNTPAKRRYQRQGFVATGERQPLPRDGIIEERMVRSL